jgi:hypothetical protein
MRTSWADSVANSASENAATGSSESNGLKRPTRSTYVPPHLRNRQPSSSDHPPPVHIAPSPANDRVGYGGPPTGSRWGGGSRPDFGRVGDNGSSGGRGGGGWSSRGGGREREVNPFADDDNTEEAFSEQENTGINFEAYDDIPVETSGDNVPPAVNTFAEIDLGEALNLNIWRCKLCETNSCSTLCYTNFSCGTGFDGLCSDRVREDCCLLLSNHQWNHAGAVCSETTTRSMYCVPSCSNSFPYKGAIMPGGILIYTIYLTCILRVLHIFYKGILCL